MPFSGTSIELVFDVLNLRIGEVAEVATFGQVLPQQTIVPKKGMVMFSLVPRCHDEYGSAK